MVGLFQIFMHQIFISSGNSLTFCRYKSDEGSGTLGQLRLFCFKIERPLHWEEECNGNFQKFGEFDDCKITSWWRIWPCSSAVQQVLPVDWLNGLSPFLVRTALTYAFAIFWCPFLSCLPRRSTNFYVFYTVTWRNRETLTACSPFVLTVLVPDEVFEKLVALIVIYIGWSRPTPMLLSCHF